MQRNLNNVLFVKTMKKRVIFTLLVVLFLFIILLTRVYAAENSTEDKAISCLEEKIGDRCDELTLEEQAFSLMALGSECKNALLDNSKDNECWPKSSCKLRDTALAIIALDRANTGTEKAEEWLISQNITPKNLEWYLEIDTTEESSCSIEYSEKEYEININGDRKLSGGAGRCLSLYNRGYWLKISDSCLNQEFKISCDKDFKTTLLYRKTGSDIIYVSSKTNAESSNGQTEEKVGAVCFEQGGECNYEGSLWATYALSRNKDREIDAFLPYLTASSSDNKRFFPETLLYLLTTDQEYFSEIISSQKPGNFWHAENSPYTEFYDTALALFALQGSSAGEISGAIGYLEDKQQSGGCFGSIRDTAFLIYALWPKTISGGDGVEISGCEEYGHYCVTRAQCDEAVGEQLDKFDCINEPSKICCSRPRQQEKSCGDLEGVLMSVCENQDKDCSGSQVESSEGLCCKGVCVEKQIEETQCEKASTSYNCRSECWDYEEEVDYDCNVRDVCCGPRKEPGKSYWWLWLLIILIIFVALAIIFRKKLQLFIFKMKKGKKGGGQTVAQGRPPFPPTRGARRIMPRRIIPHRAADARRPISKPSQSDKELEETFKKLKEMGNK